jgi:UTP--glucose-1-phosphate uridylyltransferase
LEKTFRGKGNEIQLTDALRILLKEEGIVATIIEGKRYDIGNKMDYLKTTVEFALKRKEFAKDFEEFLRETINNIDVQKK